MIEREKQKTKHNVREIKIAREGRKEMLKKKYWQE